MRRVPVEAFVAGVVRKYGALHVALNNAGIQIVKQLHEMTVEEWDDNIRVAAISPGTTDTPLLDSRRPPNITDEQWAAGKAQYGADNVDALRRMARPEEIAAAALAVASPEMSFVTGTSVVVDGGMLAGL
ncbi:SDR family oxidoreductase [Parafrankia elaeagni]|uniref:SDR family oxidoreductase n=1 Tax=Parafrankia elaeagni TaxID=222534 RepID=UPI00037B4CDE|nr:SDR family oxidoreductase [Parafrankia elaeagni]